MSLLTKDNRGYIFSLLRRKVQKNGKQIKPSKTKKQRQEQSELKRRSGDDVRQDNNAHSRERAASREAYNANQSARTRRLGINSDRSQKRSSGGDGCSISFRVEEPIMEAVDEIARRSGLTRSKTIALLIEEGLILRSR